MNTVDFFKGIVEVCPHTDVDEPPVGIMEPVQETCMISGNLACSSYFCPIIDVMLNVTVFIKSNVDRTNKVLGQQLTCKEFYGMLFIVCPHQETSPYGISCKINDDMKCQSLFCPAMECMMRYISCLRKKFKMKDVIKKTILIDNQQTEKPKTVLEEMKEAKQGESLYGTNDGWIKIYTKKHLKHVENMNNIEIQSRQEFNEKGSQQMEYYYRKI